MSTDTTHPASVPQPGTYRLTRSVSNPKPDRRAGQHYLKSWNRWVTWPAGMVFIVEREPRFPTLRRVYARGGYTMDAFPGDSPGYAAILAALEPIEEAASDYLRRRYDDLAGGYALDLLDRLAPARAELDALLDAIHVEEEAEAARQ